MLSTQQINIIIDKMKPFNPTKIGVFGSVARGEDTPESDIDIVFDSSKDYSLFDLAGLQFELEEALGKEVDLVEFDALRPRIKKYILPDVKMIYGGASAHLLRSNNLR